SERAWTKGSRGKLAEAAVATTKGLVRSGVRVKRVGPVCAVADKQLLSKTPHPKTRRFFTGELGSNLPSVRFWARGSAGGEAQGAEASWVVGDQSLWKSQKTEKLCRLLTELFCLLLALSRPLRLAGGMSI